MGLFSGKTKVYVASSVYNMAGDIKDRPDYLKTTVVGGILNNNNSSISDTITDSYLGGPGIRMRLFSTWSKDNYDPKIGMASASLGVIAKIDTELVATQITAPPGQTVYVQAANIGFGDFEKWCDQYIYENAPNRIDEEFEIDIDEVTNEITMTSLEGGSEINFIPANFQQGALYLYVDYTFYSDPSEQPPVVGDTIVYERESDLPSTFFWTTVSETPKAESTDLTETTTVKSVYSDGRPDEETTSDTSSTFNWNSYINVYKRGFNLSLTTAQVIIDNRVMTHTKFGTVEANTTSSEEVIDLGGGVTKTVTTTVTTEYVHIQYSTQTTSTQTIMDAAGSPHLLIYRRNTGNSVFDALFDTPATDSRFYPFIPIKEDNNWIDRDDEMYPICKKALKRATGGKLGEVIKSLNDNDDIGDIQFIYTAFGCSINTPEDSAKEYIYRFFQMATQAFPIDPNYPTMDSLLQAYELAKVSAEAYQQWWEDNTSGGTVTTAPPPPPVYPNIPWRKYRVRSDKNYSYDMTIGWNYAEETTHSGLGWPEAKQGNLKFEYKGNQVFERTSFRTDSSGNLVSFKTQETISVFEMLWQTSKNAYRKMQITGLFHENMVYDNKNVNIQIDEAMSDAEESGFIVPLHTNIYRSMSLVRSTQLSTACAYLILNSYKKVKQKWYTTGAFKIVVIVVAIVITIYSGGAGAGILGAYGSVGAALGFVGIAAIIVGAIANAVAAMVLMSIISTASTAIFGDKVGFIVSAIASFVAMNAGTALATGASMSTMAAGMMQADNILLLTTSVGNGISQYINASTADTIRKTEEMMQSYNTDMKAVQSKYEEMFGTGGQAVIDPLQLISMESLDSFLSRTTMVGTDVAGMSLDMITNFTDMTLDLSLE